ncbi:MAG: hypothetical protein E7001_02735 [Coriobacteriaceae bacterium]|nr:hypothetical protein [Coriobacteriaceae bacterium]
MSTRLSISGYRVASSRAYERDLSEAVGGADDDGSPWRQALLCGVRDFQEQKTYLSNLLANTSGLDSFVNIMCDVNYRQLKGHVERVVGEDNLDQHTRLCIGLYRLGTVRLVEEWSLGRIEATPEEMVAAFENGAPASLRAYLFPDQSGA